MRGADDQLTLDLAAAPVAGIVPRAQEPGLHPEQRAVAALPLDLVVTAGAGSGKTRTLVALYAALLDDPAIARVEALGPQRILCLTFTERAARELARKVRERTTDPRWRRELESAPISTFHGWCADLLRRYPIEAGVDPRFSVLTDEAAEETLRSAAHGALRGGLERGDEAARQAVELLGLGRAAETLVDLVRAVRTAGWSAREPITRFEARLSDAERRMASLAGEVEREAHALLEAARAPGALRTPLQREHLERVAAAVSAWRTGATAERADALSTAAKSAGRSWRFAGHSELREALQAKSRAYEALAREVENRFQLGIWPALTVTAREAYRRDRAARNALDYDDLLLRSRDLLLRHDEVRQEVRDRYRAILVDEHQDTDPVQDEILRILIGEHALAGDPRPDDPRWCVVGDAKQAIYGFRGAMVEAFEALSRAAEGRGARRELAANYRSRPELVAFHNAFFASVLVPGPGGDRPPHAPQVPHRAPAGGPAVEFLDPAGLEGVAEEGREIEARAIAARIVAACGPGDGGVRVEDPETGAERAARPGDVVVLLRRLTQVEPYRRALDLVGLESVVVGSGSFWVRQETYDVLNALDAALRPQDPVPFVAFLRSPMVGLPDDAIWRLLRDRDRHAPIGAHVENADVADGLESAEAARLREALEILDGIRERADACPPGAVVAWLVDRTGYASVLDALPDRAQRRANLERLIALADRAPAEGHALLSQWAAALRRRADRPPRDRDASLPEVGDRIRILSIHQAKGLEFPVVVLADLGGTTGRGPGVVRFDPRIGIAAKVWIDPAEPPVDTRAYAIAREAAREREEAEESRLLYVAATRARDRLILSAGASGARWLEQVRAFAGAEGSGPLVSVASLRSWSERFSAALGPAAALADAGTPVRPAAPAAPGEAAARELAAELAGEPPEPPAVAVAREAAAAALDRGARSHSALERIPLDPPPDDVRAWLDGPGGLSVGEAAPLAAFWTREVLPELREAAEVARERPFRLRLPGGGIVVGTIDAIWRGTDGRWTVGDYKFAGADEESAARHRAQLAVYALAASAALGLDAIGGRLWYVDQDRTEHLRWSGPELETLASELDRAFDRLAPVYVEDAATAASSE